MFKSTSKVYESTTLENVYTYSSISYQLYLYYSILFAVVFLYRIIIDKISIILLSNYCRIRKYSH